MKNVNRRSITTILTFLAIASFSSCNRGYGCPTNFSIQEGIDVLLAMAASLF